MRIATAGAPVTATAIEQAAAAVGAAAPLALLRQESRDNVYKIVHVGRTPLVTHRY